MPTPPPPAAHQIWLETENANQREGRMVKVPMVTFHEEEGMMPNLADTGIDSYRYRCFYCDRPCDFDLVPHKPVLVKCLHCETVHSRSEPDGRVHDFQDVWAEHFAAATAKVVWSCEVPVCRVKVYWDMLVEQLERGGQNTRGAEQLWASSSGQWISVGDVPNITNALRNWQNAHPSASSVGRGRGYRGGRRGGS